MIVASSTFSYADFALYILKLCYMYIQILTFSHFLMD